MKIESENKQHSLFQIFDRFKQIGEYQLNQAKLSVKGSGDFVIANNY